MKYTSFKKVYNSGGFEHTDYTDKTYFDFRKVSITKAAEHFGNLNIHVAECEDIIDNPELYQ